MAKKVTGFLKLQVPAGAANPSPPIGPALGQRGLNIMEFCKAFNAQTQKIEKNTPIPVIITTYQDRSFTFEMKTPPVSYFHQESGEARERIEDPRPRIGRADKQGPGARDRRTEDEGSQLRHDRSGDEDDRRFRPLDGHHGVGVTAMTLGKRTKAAREGIDRDKAYSIAEAVKLVKERAKAKFDETIEIAMNLGVDPKHADQMVRGVVTLPNGSGRTVRVGVFARGAKADEAKAAGADVVGAEDLVEKVNGGAIDFDRCIATPDMMPLVGRLGKVLGPRGMMPNPKVGTVTMDITNAVKGAKGGSVEFRVEKAGIVQAGVGKASFSEDKLVENIKAFADAVQKAKPAGAKGHYINRVAISSTMGPGVKVEIPSLFA